MKTNFNILIIEDHPIILEGFREGFRKLGIKKPEWEFYFKVASTCENALYILENEKPAKPWDIILLDIGVPIVNDGRYFSGEDLGMLIRKRYKETKLIISSVFDSNYRIRNLLQSINPEGFLIKRDSTPRIIEMALMEVFHGGRFYSKKVLQVLQKNIAIPVWLDEHDRRILYELSIGTKTSHLYKIIPLSQASIARRKSRLKENFELETTSDKELIRKAKELGFI